MAEAEWAKGRWAELGSEGWSGKDQSLPLKGQDRALEERKEGV